jgi:hypothetical protein
MVNRFPFWARHLYPNFSAGALEDVLNLSPAETE